VVSPSQPAVGRHCRRRWPDGALSACNLLIFAGVFLLQWGIGLAIDGFKALGWGVASAFQGALALLAGVLRRLACVVFASR